MFVCRTLEEIYPKHAIEGARPDSITVLVFRVEVSRDNRAVWSLCRNEGNYSGYWGETAGQLRSRVKSNVQSATGKTLPIFQSVRHGKPVSRTEAKRLTGMTLGAAALDKLVDTVSENPHNPANENYRKPKAAPKPKSEPNAAEALAERIRHARGKRDEWESRAASATRRAAKWHKRQARLTGQLEKLAEAEVKAAGSVGTGD